jgi:hypothetical protein
MKYLLLCLLITGCSTPPGFGEQQPLAANLKAPCPDLPKLEGTTGAHVLPWALATIDLYELCQAKHLETVKAFEAPLKK